MPIQWKLLIVLLTVAVPPLFIIGYFDQLAARTLIAELLVVREQEVEKRAGESLLGHARDYALLASRQLTLMEMGLQSAGKDVAASRAGRAVAKPVGLGDDDFRTISLIVHSGAVLQLWPERIALPPDRVPPQAGALYRRAAAATEPVLMAYPPAQPGGLASLVGATPLPSPDGSLAVLVADLSFASTLQDIGRSSAEGEDISSLIAFHALQERTLAPLARRGEADVMGLSANPPPELMDGLADGASGLLRQTLGGREYLIAFAPLANRELYLLLARPVDNLLGPVSEAQARVNRRIEQQIMVGGMSLILLLIAAVLLSFIGARSITRPVKELKAVARRIADGDLNARCHLQTGDELEDLGNTFNEMLPKLNERLKMQDALGLAMEVQQKLLPDQAPSVAGFDIAGRSMYCDETGGDYYDFLELNRLDSRQVGIAVGDVTGHGIAAALLMASARAMLRSHAGESSDLSKMMTSINRHLSGDAHAGRFMTLFYGVLDGVKKTIRWVSAGHAPAILFDPASGQFMELPGRDIPLGIDGSWAYHEEIRFGWTAGQILAIGTDGIWEMRNKKGEMFGMDLLREVIRDNAALSAEDICEAVAQSLDVHRGLRDQEDDVTLVVVKFLE